MTKIIPKDGPVADLIAELAHVPRERIKDWCLVVQYDTGIALVHTLCCEEHAREGLARIAATPPDIPDTHLYDGEN